MCEVVLDLVCMLSLALLTKVMTWLAMALVVLEMGGGNWCFIFNNVYLGYGVSAVIGAFSGL